MPPALAAQVAAVRAELETRPDGLVAHVQRVLVEALDLAARWDLDPLRVELATWGHDLFRSHTAEEQLRLAGECGIELDAAAAAAPVLLHGPIGAVVMRERFGVTDDEALAAVRDHTLGFAEMPLIAKVILIADKVEKRKRGRRPVMAPIRNLARRDLDLALLCWADWKWVDERVGNLMASPTHWEARVAWVSEQHLDADLPGRVDDEAYAAALARHADADALTSTRDWGEGVDYRKAERRQRPRPAPVDEGA